MSKVNSQIADIKDLILSVIEENPQNEKLFSFINLCHKIAIAYLRIKKKSESYYINNFGMSIKDIAWDAIPELFKRNEEGRFYELKEYFDKNDIKIKSDVDIWILLRRIIFSVVNHHLYRLNKIFDPSLGKIIRNIKLHVRNDSSLEMSEFLGTTIVHPKNYNTSNNHLPEIQPEFLESEFLSAVTKLNSLPDMLHVLNSILLESENYRKTFPLVETALLIRKAFAMNQIFESKNNDIDSISKDSLEILINDSLRSIEQKIKSYIKKSKVDHYLGEIYLKAIKEILKNKYSEDENTDSYFNILKRYLPELKKEVYLHEHREIIEYLAKTAKSELITLIKKEIISP
jgi:hypothetical protein